jgi:hypothetical protein
MGVIDFEKNRLRQQEIEVKALIALMKYARLHEVKLDAEMKLCKFAFPEEVTKKINQETLEVE